MLWGVVDAADDGIGIGAGVSVFVWIYGNKLNYYFVINCDYMKYVNCSRVTFC